VVKWPIRLRRISGASMEPSFTEDKLIVGTSWYQHLKVGHVVMFRHKDMEMIKRIKNIEKDHFFLVGDNEAASTDSREFGWVHIDNVIARVIWPL
jgi:nickel-type superoxide dismutase maturation protease